MSQEESPSVPYEDALREHDEVKSNALSCDTLNEQLTKCRQRATKLEQDKEHWRLEYQLLQLRHCKVSAKLYVSVELFTVSLHRLHFDVTFVCVPQKVKDLEGQIESLSGTTTPHSDDSQPDKLPSVDPATVTNLVSLCS